MGVWLSDSGCDRGCGSFPIIAVFIKSGAQHHRGSPNIYELGIIEVKSPGGALVRAYWAERAVAELISQRSSVGADPQLVRDAVAGYFKRRNADF